jgi:hypothetical protein
VSSRSVSGFFRGEFRDDGSEVVGLERLVFRGGSEVEGGEHGTLEVQMSYTSGFQFEDPICDDVLLNLRRPTHHALGTL